MGQYTDDDDEEEEVEQRIGHRERHEGMKGMQKQRGTRCANISNFPPRRVLIVFRFCTSSGRLKHLGSRGVFS